MKKNKFKWPTKEEFLRLGKKLFSWLPFFVACGFTLFAAVFFIVPTEDAEAAEAARGQYVSVTVKAPFQFTMTSPQTADSTSTTDEEGYYTATYSTQSMVGSNGKPVEHTLTIKATDESIRYYQLPVNIVCEGLISNTLVQDGWQGGIGLQNEEPIKYTGNFGGTSSSKATITFASKNYARMVPITIEAQGEINMEYVFNFFCWSDKYTEKYKLSGDISTTENYTQQMTSKVPFWTPNSEIPSEGAKLFLNPEYTLANARVTWNYIDNNGEKCSMTYDGSKRAKGEAQRYWGLGLSYTEDTVIFAPMTVGKEPNFVPDTKEIKISVITHRYSPGISKVYVRQPQGLPYLEDYGQLCYLQDPNDMIGIRSVVTSYKDPKYVVKSRAPASYYDFTEANFEYYDLAKLNDTSSLDERFTDAAKLNPTYFDTGGSGYDSYIAFKRVPKKDAYGFDTDGFNLEYEGYEADTEVAVVISNITFKSFFKLNVSTNNLDTIKTVTSNKYVVTNYYDGSLASGEYDFLQSSSEVMEHPVDKVPSFYTIPNEHAFEFDINFADDCQYNLENLGYLYTCPYTYSISEKIKDVLSITDKNDNDITYNFTFYADRLHIYIPEDIITSDITVTIKQGPEKFVDCLNSFHFENEDIKNNVSVYGMQMIQSSLGDDTVIAVTGDKIDYEIVKNSRTYYYAVKLLANDSQEGYNYTFDNFGVESSRGARIKILNGEELDKIGLKDDDHIRYISVYLEDPNATDHRISFTGIYTTLKTIEIKLSDNSIEEMKADSFIGAIEPQFSSENKKWTMKLYHGQYLNFTVVPKEGYYLNRSDILTISSQGGSYEVKLNELGSNMGVLVHNVKCDLKLEVNAQQAPLSITFEDVEGFKYYSVNESNGNINSIGDQIFDIVTVDPDSDYYFAIKADNGYDLSTVSLKNHDTDLSNISIDEQYKYYKIEKIQQYAKISGTIDKSTYTITFVKDAYNTTSGSEESKAVITYTQDDEQISSLNIVHGESISFEVGLEDRFSNSKIKVYSKWDDGSAEEIFAFDGIYTLSNIMHNCEVYVEGVELNQYIINFVENDKVQYELDGKLKSSDAISVKHGDNYNFKLIPKKGYQITDKTIVNHRTVEGTMSLKPTSAGNYTISNMLQDCTIIVENAEDIIYKISFKNQGGVTYRNRDGDVITESLSIKYGENFEFAVELDDAYDDSIQGMKPIANDDKSINSRVNKLAEGKYLISNVIEDINLEVLNVRKNRYTVNLVKMEGVDFHNSNGKVITGPNEVEHGESLNFKVYVYPAYDGSKLKIMLGDNPLAAQTAGDYLVEGVTENKTVTVIGVEESLVTRLINTINNLPNPISDLDDVDKVIEASKMYQLIPADQRHLVTNISVLNSLQDQSKGFHHVNNGITVEGISWRIKLVAVPISSSTEACSRIYKKLDSEYILSLYDVYFWDTVNEVRYKPAKEQTITLTLPKPDLKYFENATGVCGDAKGDVDFLSLTFSGNSVHININSPGYIGVIADRTSTPGRSSLLDAADANWETLTNALSSFGIGSSKEDKSQGTSIFNDIENDSDSNDIIQEETGNISEKYKSRNNKVTAQGSAIRLVLVLMIIILIAVIVWVIVKKRKERKAMDN